MKGVLIWTCKGGAVMRPTWLVAVPLSVALGVPPKLHAQELWPAACPFDFVQRVSASGLPRGTDALPQCLTECPKRGTLELVREPAMAADRCFIAVSMRAPLRGDASQTASELRDIDLDGEPELLEIRGIGNRAKQIYVFKQSEEGARYIGELVAHPSFYVARDREGELLILNIHRLAEGQVHLQHIKHVDGEFVVVRQVPVQ